MFLLFELPYCLLFRKAIGIATIQNDCPEPRITFEIASTMITIRPYAPPDRAACLHLFDTNTPVYFAPNERADYEEFLNNVPAAYYLWQDFHIHQDGTHYFI